MSGKIFFNSHKILTGLLAGLLGLVGGVAAASYSVGAEKTKITEKLEAHDRYIVSTDAAVKEINEAIQTIRIDIAVLKNSVSSSHTPTQ